LTAITFPTTNHLHRSITATEIQKLPSFSMTGATRIFIASVVALIGLLTLHLLDPDNTSTLEAFYAGCFLGMSTPERLKGWFQPLFGALVLTAVLVLVRAFLPGVGGGLGLAAFVTVALLVALSRATARMRPNADTQSRELSLRL
jgi:hypothetical protein